jgi:hypothetical protein
MTQRSLLKRAVDALGGTAVIKVRDAKRLEAVAAGLHPGMPAKTIKLRLCGGVVRVTVPDRPKVVPDENDIAAVAETFQRPCEEVELAARYLPLVSPDTLASLALQMMKALTRCSQCTCGAADVPLVAGLVEAQRRPWTNATVDRELGGVKASLPGSLVITVLSGLQLRVFSLPGRKPELSHEGTP